jgi:hypothetical protein
MVPAALAAALSLPAAAQAQTISLGAVAPAGLMTTCASCNAFQLASATTGPSYEVPTGTGWTITSWSATGGSAASNARLRVIHATAVAHQYKLISDSALESVPANTTQSFPVSIPVEAYDRIGVGTDSSTTNHFPIDFPGISGDSQGQVSSALLVPGKTLGPTGTMSDTTMYTYQLRANIQVTLTRPDPSPAPAPAPVAVQPKCKKKKKHSKRAEAAKKKRCKKKKGR